MKRPKGHIMQCRGGELFLGGHLVSGFCRPRRDVVVNHVIDAVVKIGQTVFENVSFGFIHRPVPGVGVGSHELVDFTIVVERYRSDLDEQAKKVYEKSN